MSSRAAKNAILEEKFTFYNRVIYSYPNLSFRARYIDLFSFRTPSEKASFSSPRVTAD